MAQWQSRGHGQNSDRTRDAFLALDAACTDVRQYYCRSNHYSCEVQASGSGDGPQTGPQWSWNRPR